MLHIIQLYKWQFAAAGAFAWIVVQAVAWILGELNDIIALSPYAASFIISFVGTLVFAIIGIQVLIIGAIRLHKEVKGKPALKK